MDKRTRKRDAEKFLKLVVVSLGMIFSEQTRELIRSHKVFCMIIVFVLGILSQDGRHRAFRQRPVEAKWDSILKEAGKPDIGAYREHLQRFVGILKESFKRGPFRPIYQTQIERVSTRERLSNMIDVFKLSRSMIKAPKTKPPEFASPRPPESKSDKSIDTQNLDQKLDSPCKE